MDDSDAKKAQDPVVMIVERRKERNADLSPHEVMKLVRKRSAKRIRTETGSDDQQ